jgi:serine/threonine-protein kinase HipA
MAQREKEIKVFADWKEPNKPTQMGIIDVSILRGKEIFSFTYSKDWLLQQERMKTSFRI